MLTVPGLAVRNLRHRRVRTMFLAALVLILSAALFTSRVLTESMKTCIDKTVDRIGADVIVAPGEYESDLSDSLFSGGLCSFYFEKSLMDQVKKTDGIDKISPQLYIASLDAACCSVPVQIVAFEPESDFIVQPWMSGSNVSELKKGQTVVGSKITAKAGDKISFFGQEYEVAGKLEETGTSYDNCAFMNFETAYTLFDSFQIKYVTDLTEPQTACRFICDYQFRVLRKCPCDRHTPLLSAGQICRIFGKHILDSKKLRQIRDPFFIRFPVFPQRKWQQDIFHDRQILEKILSLHDITKVASPQNR